MCGQLESVVCPTRHRFGETVKYLFIHREGCDAVGVKHDTPQVLPHFGVPRIALLHGEIMC